MTGIRSLVLLLGAATLPTQFAVANVDSTDTLPDKVFINEFEQYTLAINNFLVWCSINENGASYSPSMTFNDHVVVDLFAQPVTGFIWGHWEGTDADTGAGDTSQQTTVTMTSDRDVLACCPFPNNTGC